MNKKGFTLIELLAVIVILAVIALITVPAVMSVVSDAKQSAFKDSAYGLIKTADAEYVQDTFEDNIIDKFFLFTNGVMTSYPSGSTLDYKGSTPLDGGLVLHSDGTVTMAIHDGTYCAIKTREISEVTVSVKTKVNCVSEILYSQATAPFSNLVANGDFSNGTTSWPATSGTASVSGGIYSLTASGSSNNTQSMQSSAIPISTVTGHKLYMNAKLRVTNSSGWTLSIYFEGGATQSVYVKSQPTKDQWYTETGIITKTGTTGNLIFTIYSGYIDALTAAGKTMQAQYVIALDLTALYGAGNEPTTAQMDHNLNKVWIDTANSNTPKRFTAGGWISF